MKDVMIFRGREDYPEEVASKWDDIRRGEGVLVDGTGHEVESLEDASLLLYPDVEFMEIPSGLTGMGPGELPPVGRIPVGRPDGPDPWPPIGDSWIRKSDAHLMVRVGDTIVDATAESVSEVLTPQLD